MSSSTRSLVSPTITRSAGWTHSRTARLRASASTVGPVVSRAICEQECESDCSGAGKPGCGAEFGICWWCAAGRDLWLIQAVFQYGRCYGLGCFAFSDELGSVAKYQEACGKLVGVVGRVLLVRWGFFFFSLFVVSLGLRLVAFVR